MSLPLEVPETVGGSLCSDSSFQNFHPPHLLIYHCYGWAEKEQEERQNKNSPETGDRESGLLLAAVSTVQLYWHSGAPAFLPTKMCQGRDKQFSSSPFSFCWKSEADTAMFLRHSVLMAIGVHWPGRGQSATQSHIPSPAPLCKCTGRAEDACTAWIQAGRHLGLQERCWEQIWGSLYWQLVFKDLDLP